MDSVEAALARILDLEARVTALEQALGGNAPSDFCRSSGERAMRQDSADFDAKSTVVEYFKCSACGKTDLRSWRPR
jgi:hypothetical protein